MFYSISQQGNICEVKEVNATVDLSCYYYFIIVMLCCEIVVYWRCTGPIVWNTLNCAPGDNSKGERELALSYTTYKKIENLHQAKKALGYN